jgi:hypothetical protein
MVCHIFLKDAKVLRLFVLGAAGLQLASASLRYTLDHFGVTGALANVSNLVEMAGIATTVLLIVTVVHQDAVPGIRQDWLVRPVRRRDVLLAKLFFIVVLVHGPILLSDTLQALANGFAAPQSLGAAASRSLYLLFGLSIPVLAFASLTRNLTEAVIGAVWAVLGFAALQILINNRGQIGPLRGTGLFWVAEALMFSVASVGSVCVLMLQYHRRKTTVARGLMIVVGVLFLLAYVTPWRYAFGLEQWLASGPRAGDDLLLSFTPSLDQLRLPIGMSRNAVATAPSGATRDEASTVYIPLQIAGLSQDELLNTDRAEVVLTSPNQEVLYRGNADELVVHQERSGEPVHFTIGIRRSPFFRDLGPDDDVLPRDVGSTNSRMLVYQGVALPRTLYDHIKDQPLRFEVTYWLTLFQGDTYTLPALNGDVDVPSVGHCRTRIDDKGDDIQMRCIQAGTSLTNCTTMFLEHVPSGKHNPTKFSCWPNYAPYFGQYSPDAMSRARAAFPFRDLTGVATYPVDFTQLPESRIVLRVFRPLDHFVHQLLIPEIRLSEWEAVSRT